MAQPLQILMLRLSLLAMGNGMINLNGVTVFFDHRLVLGDLQESEAGAAVFHADRYWRRCRRDWQDGYPGVFM